MESFFPVPVPVKNFHKKWSDKPRVYYRSPFYFFYKKIKKDKNLKKESESTRVAYRSTLKSGAS